MAEKTIYLIRHAQPDFPGGEKICLGQKNDLPLSDDGLALAAQLGALLQNTPIECVYTSPLLRARQTAMPIAAARCPLEAVADLTELHGGEWDGMPFSILRRQYPHCFGPGAKPTCPPGGECDEDGLARARAALDKIAQQTRRCAAVVAHSGVNRLLLCDLTGKPLIEKKQMSQNYGAVNILKYDEHGWRVEHIGLEAHELAAYL